MENHLLQTIKLKVEQDLKSQIQKTKQHQMQRFSHRQSGKGVFVTKEFMYVGNLKNGKFHGRGKQKYKGGQMSGIYLNNTLHGYGITQRQDSIYIGSFRDNYCSGEVSAALWKGMWFRGHLIQGEKEIRFFNSNKTVKIQDGLYYQQELVYGKYREFNNDQLQCQVQGYFEKREFILSNSILPLGGKHKTFHESKYRKFCKEFGIEPINPKSFIELSNMIYPDGTKYAGEAIGLMRQGYGKVKAITGDVYLGYFNNNKMQGFGILKSLSCEVYQGYWYNDKRNGWGIQEYEDYRKYKGQFRNKTEHGVALQYNEKPKYNQFRQFCTRKTNGDLSMQLISQNTLIIAQYYSDNVRIQSYFKLIERNTITKDEKQSFSLGGNAQRVYNQTYGVGIFQLENEIIVGSLFDLQSFRQGTSLKLTGYLKIFDIKQTNLEESLIVVQKNGNYFIEGKFKNGHFNGRRVTNLPNGNIHEIPCKENKYDTKGLEQTKDEFQQNKWCQESWRIEEII